MAPQNNVSVNAAPGMTVRIQRPNNNALSLGDIFRICLSNWYWFVLSVVLCCGLATAYLLRTPKVYTRQASIQIKENGKNNQSLVSQLSNAGDLNMFDVASSVNNELVAIQSPALILEAAKRLHLEYTYLVDGTFHKLTVYGRTLPVQVEFLDLNDMNSASAELTLKPDGSFILSDFKKDGIDMAASAVSGKLGATVETAIGKAEVKPSAYPAKLTENMTIYVSRSSMLGAMSACKSKLTAALENKNADIINLTYNDVNIQRAEEFLNTLIGVYNENWIKDKNQIAVSTSQFIGERLAVIEDELGNVDSNISTFKSENLLPDVGAASSMALTQAAQASNNITILNAQLYMARQVRSYVNDRSKQNDLLPANSGIDDPTIEKQISEYNAQLLQRNSLVANSSEKNPLVQDMDAKLKDMRATIVGSMDNAISSINAQIRGQQSTRNQSTSQLASNPNQAKYLLSVERQQKVKESLYLFLLQKREENELSQAFTAYNTRLITPPMGSMAPTAPVSNKIILMALLAGLAIPFGILYLKESNNTKVRNRKDLERMTMPFVGEIPFYLKKGEKKAKKIKKGERDEEVRKIVVKHGCRNIINESFRVLRTNLEFMTKVGQTPVIMIVSSLPYSGKTFITGNLGAGFALKNKKVLLIDMDMRKASLSNLVGNPQTGLSDYLAGRVPEWAPLIQATSVEGMDVLPVGTLPPNPAELLFSERLDGMMANIKAAYDVVLLDCPPAELVADSSIIAQFANMTCFIIRSGNLEREVLPSIDNLYKEKKFPNMALVLNGTQAGKGRYGYSYGYGYGYGYGTYGGYTKED